MATSKEKKDTQHVLVVTRVRPFNSMELEAGAKNCIELHGKDVIAKMLHGTKRFSFDRVFGMDSKQVDVYNTVIGPMIGEIMQGYNCTVFAYGQTGTGKTYTMVGNNTVANQENINDPELGIIPRTLDNLFTSLSANADVDFTVRVSYLELYNEVLIDLLSNEEKVLKIFEDQKVKGAVRVHGLEEETVFTKSQVFEILQKGSQKRMTAGTLMNARSSRSHTVFTITLHSRELTPDGEELVKTGKLNLVDLAGSENITKSGAVEKRAREAGNINQSLLTLGRVIKALVDNNSHIPYRESKLTRILQDSLGGRTKTAIIATISPASSNLEETLSTLDYAFRARNITNRPEINQRMSKKALIQKYLEEIEQLKKDLTAARTQHGIYLNPENYEMMLENEKKQKEELFRTVEQCSAFESRYNEVQRMKEELEECCNVAKSELAHTNEELDKLKTLRKMHRRERRIHQKLIDIYDESQTAFEEHSKRLSEHLDMAVRDQQLLISKVQYLYAVVEGNEKFTNDFASEYSDMQYHMEKDFSDSMQHIQDKSDELLDKFTRNTEVANNIFSTYDNSLDHFKLLMNSFGSKTRHMLDKMSEYCLERIDQNGELLQNILEGNGQAIQLTTNTLRDELTNIELIIDSYRKRLANDKKSHEEQYEALKKDILTHQTAVTKNFERFKRTVSQFLETVDPIGKNVEGSADKVFKRCCEIDKDLNRRLEKLSLDVKQNIDEIKHVMQNDHLEGVKHIVQDQRENVFKYQTMTTEFMKKVMNRIDKYNTEHVSGADDVSIAAMKLNRSAALGDEVYNKFAGEIEIQMETVVAVIDALRDRGILMVNANDGYVKLTNEVVEGIAIHREQYKKDAETISALSETKVAILKGKMDEDQKIYCSAHNAVVDLANEREDYFKKFRTDHRLRIAHICDSVTGYLTSLAFPKAQGDTPKVKQQQPRGTPKKVSRSLLLQLLEEEPESDPDDETDTTSSF